MYFMSKYTDIIFKFWRRKVGGQRLPFFDGSGRIQADLDAHEQGSHCAQTRKLCQFLWRRLLIMLRFIICEDNNFIT